MLVLLVHVFLSLDSFFISDLAKKAKITAKIDFCGIDIMGRNGLSFITKREVNRCKHTV